MKEIVSFLRKIALFRHLKAGEIKALAKDVQVRPYPDRSHIFGKGDKADHLYIVLSGRVKIYTRSDAKMRTTFAYLGPGDFFGEMALLSTEPRSAYAEAAEDSKILLLHRKDFARLLRDNIAFSADLLQILSQRLRRADAQIENILFQNILGRLARVICQLARDSGEKVKNGHLIRENFTRQELADMVGTTREPLSRALALLRRVQVVRFQNDGIFLPNLRKMEALAGIAAEDQA